MTIRELFNIESAKSKGIDDYEAGGIPFITNTEINNGIAKFVTPQSGDKIFDGPLICISGLGYATVHLDRVLPKGNRGDSCSLLTPMNTMNYFELLYYASLFNLIHKWRFSFGRKVSISRIMALEMRPQYEDSTINMAKGLANVNERMIADMEQAFGIIKTS